MAGCDKNRNGDGQLAFVDHVVEHNRHKVFVGVPVHEDHHRGGLAGIVLGGDIDPPVAHGPFVDLASPGGLQDHFALRNARLALALGRGRVDLKLSAAPWLATDHKLPAGAKALGEAGGGGPDSRALDMLEGKRPAAVVGDKHWLRLTIGQLNREGDFQLIGLEGTAFEVVRAEPGAQGLHEALVGLAGLERRAQGVVAESLLRGQCDKWEGEHDYLTTVKSVRLRLIRTVSWCSLSRVSG